MKHKQIGIFAILTIAVTAAILGTSLSQATPAYANDEKKCKNNDDNNCNDTHKTQKIHAKNECEIENTNKDHSSDNTNENTLVCVNAAQNLKDSAQIFGETDETDGTDESADSEQPSNSEEAVE